MNCVIVALFFKLLISCYEVCCQNYFQFNVLPSIMPCTLLDPEVVHFNSRKIALWEEMSLKRHGIVR